MAPVVSIITPAFNASATIAETIASVRAQTMTDWEMWIVDDGSTDDTLHVARAAAGGDGRITICQRPQGPSGAAGVVRNHVIRETRGRYLAFVDADDVWLPTYLAKQLDLARETGATLVHCGWTNLMPDGTNVDEPPRCPAGMSEGLDLLRLLIRRSVTTCSMAVVERSAVLNVGMFDPDSRFKGPEDLDLWLRLAVGGRFFHNPERLVLYRVRPTSMSRNVINNAAGTILALQNLRHRHPELLRPLMADWRRRVSQESFAVGAAKLLERSPDRGLRELLRAIRYGPALFSRWLWLGLAITGSTAARRWVAWRTAVVTPATTRSLRGRA